MRMKPELDLGDAEKMLDRAEQEARSNGWPVSIAVVDQGGFLIAFRRLPGASRSSVQIAIDKARCSALFRRPTSFFEDMLSSGIAGTSSLANVVPMTGGLPIVYQDDVLGGIAVSGVKSAFDVQLAQAGLDALSAADE